MKKKDENVNKYVPKLAKILLLIALFTLLVDITARSNANFAEWMTLGVTYFIRRALAKATSAFAFSLAELLIILSPVFLVVILVVASKRDGAKSKIRFLSGFLAFLSLFYTGYVFTLGVGYHRTSLASRIELNAVEVTKENLYSTLLTLKRECEELLPLIEFSENGSSVANADFDTLCDDIINGYEKLDSDFPSLEIKTFDSRAKAVHFSRAMTLVDILGVYTFFTGESNVNVHYPDYTAPFTIAHELAHQRGISRENEANFVAFLVCIRSEDPYVRYSGYMNMFEYVASALSRTDKDLLKEVYSTLDLRMYGEMKAYSDFYHANKNELLGKISDFVNDNYLKANGTEGVVSYGLVVSLCVAYYS